jgi:hypothetical protein
MEVEIDMMEAQEWTMKIQLIDTDSTLKVEEEQWWKIVLIDVDPQAAEVQLQQARHNKDQIAIIHKCVLLIRTWKVRTRNLMRQPNVRERDDDWLNCLSYRERRR